jgi:hypothetical protein
MGGSGAGGTFNCIGGAGADAEPSAYVYGGIGGASAFGGGGRAGNPNGLVGQAPGSGGGGAYGPTGGSGGAGAPGVIILEW